MGLGLSQYGFRWRRLFLGDNRKNRLATWPHLAISIGRVWWSLWPTADNARREHPPHVVTA
jgi:hypothetical protein